MNKQQKHIIPNKSWNISQIFHFETPPKKNTKQNTPSAACPPCARMASRRACRIRVIAPSCWVDLCFLYALQTIHPWYIYLHEWWSFIVKCVINIPSSHTSFWEYDVSSRRKNLEKKREQQGFSKHPFCRKSVTPKPTIKNHHLNVGKYPK